MTTVVYLYEQRFREWRKRLSGIYRFARERGWNVRVVEISEVRGSVGEMFGFWKAAGAIVEGGTVVGIDAKGDSGFGIPIVWCDVDAPVLRGRNHLVVQHDSQEVARLAVAELLQMNCRCYGFVGFHDQIHWSEVRRRGFVDEMRRAKRPYRLFDPAHGRRVCAAVDFYPALENWLSEMERPCGIFAVNDEMGDHVLRAARKLGVAVPDEMAVIGVDNDVMLCESTVPTLTSIMPDFEQSGYSAADLLARRLANPRMRSETVSFGSCGVVSRGSVRKSPNVDALVQKALEYIRVRACDGIRVDDVARFMGMGRRSADGRFRRFAGHTIQREIEHSRFLRACEIIRRPGMRLDVVYAEVGYRNERSLRHLFYKECGISPSEWRLKNCPAI